MIPLLVPAAVKVSLAVAVALPTLVAHEGLKQRPYVDSVGKETVCVGETKDVQNRKYSRTECLMMAAERLYKDYEKPIRRCTPNWDNLPLQTQVALINFSYNVGVRGYCRSTAKSKMVKGDIKGGCNALLMWDKGRVNGKLVVIKGLQKRRQDERNLCLQGVA